MATITADPDIFTAIVRVLTDVLSCPVTVTSDLVSALASFQDAHCLNPQIQPAFTATALREFVHAMPAQVIHEVEEPLGMAVTLVRWDDRLLVIGPYTHAPMYPGTAEEVMSRLGIPTAYLSLYKLYRTRYAIVDAEYVHRSASAVLRAGGGEDAAGTLQHVKAEGVPSRPASATRRNPLRSP